MNKLKILLALLCVALLCVACGKDPVDSTDPISPTDPSEQLSATEEQPTEAPLPGVEENDFEEDDIQIPTDPVVDNTGSGVTNTGSGNGGSGSQGGSGNQGGSGSQGGTGNEGGSGSQGGTGNEGGSGSQGGSGNEGGSGNQGGSENPTDPETGVSYVSYEEYNAMSPAEQVEYFNRFPSMEAFVKWYNEAKAEYEKDHGAIEIGGDGSVDLGEIINP